jgi:transcriptional antiterminator RfaH
LGTWVRKAAVADLVLTLETGEGSFHRDLEVRVCSVSAIGVKGGSLPRGTRESTETTKSRSREPKRRINGTEIMDGRDKFCWHLIHTHPRQEARAEHNLRTMNVETYVPVYRTGRHSRTASKGSGDFKPLFPRYVFARFKVNDLYHRVRFTRGVHAIVCFDDLPAIVDDEIIDLIRLRESKHGSVRLGEFKAGDKVVVRGGAFERLHAIFERPTSDNERVVLLLESVGFQGRIIVDLDSIAPAKLGADNEPYYQ